MSDFILGFLAGIALSGVVFLVGLTYLSHVTAAENKELKLERFKSCHFKNGEVKHETV